MEQFLLSSNEKTRRVKFVITSDDLTETTANTAQAIDLMAVAAGTVVRSAGFYLPTPLQDSSDAAFNSSTLSLGDGGSATALLTAQETNENGTEIVCANSNTGKAYAAAATLKATFGSMSAKSLSDIDTGEVWVFVEYEDLTKL